MTTAQAQDTPTDDRGDRDDNDGFRFKTEVQVRFGDLDLLGHVNNAVYLTYFETAHVAYWAAVTGKADLQGFDMILAETTCTFRSPAFYDEWLDVWVKPTALGRSSVRYEYRINERTTGRLVATGRSVMVRYDREAGRAAPFPPELRARYEAFAGRPLGQD